MFDLLLAAGGLRKARSGITRRHCLFFRRLHLGLGNQVLAALEHRLQLPAANLSTDGFWVAPPSAADFLNRVQWLIDGWSDYGCGFHFWVWLLSAAL